MSNPSAKPQGMQRADASGYEKRDASAKGIFWSVAGLLLVLVILEVVVHFVLAGFRQKPLSTDRYTGTIRHNPEARPNFPRLQISPVADLSDFRSKEAEMLANYGWVNQTAGIVRVPIDRAMELVLQQGLPARTNGQPGKAGPSSFELQQQRPKSKQPEIGGEQ
jgi:hypothetical protein